MKTELSGTVYIKLYLFENSNIYLSDVSIDFEPLGLCSKTIMPYLVSSKSSLNQIILLNDEIIILYRPFFALLCYSIAKGEILVLSSTIRVFLGIYFIINKIKAFRNLNFRNCWICQLMIFLDGFALVGQQAIYLA